MDILKEFLQGNETEVKIAICNSATFVLPSEVLLHLRLDTVKDVNYFYNDRNNPVLIDTIERLQPSSLTIVEIAWGDLFTTFIKSSDKGEEIVAIEERDKSCKPLVDFLCGIKE